MKSCLLFLFILLTGAGLASAQTPSVTSIWFTGTSHSVTVVHFNSSGWGNGWLRIRYIQSPGTCTGGTGGNIQPTLYAAYLSQDEPSTDMREPLGGLLANTTYQVCPEISNDNVNWSSGIGATVTTSPLPAIHPAPPVPPATFNTSYPNTAGYTQVTVASDCHDLSSDLQTALTNQTTNGTVINIPAGTVCSGQYYLQNPAADVMQFQSSAVNTTNNTITLPNHGFAEGQGIVFGTWYACPIAYVSSTECNSSGAGPIIPGQLYYAHVLDANTIQVYSGAPMASGGSLIALTNGGDMYYAFPTSFLSVVKWPRPLYWIIIRTATPDSQFDPEHVRVSPAWAPTMAVLQLPNLYQGTTNNNILFDASSPDGNEMTMNANIRFVGIEFTYTPSNDLGSDVSPHGELFNVEEWNANIIADRCWFHSLPPPDRVSRAFWWNGMDVAIVDSYIDGMQFYHPNYSGMNLSNPTATSISISPGTYAWGSGKATFANPVTINLSGTNGAGGQGLLTFFENSGQFDVVPPPGVTATVSGYSPAHMVTTGTSNTGGACCSTGYPESVSGPDYYFVDPIFSASPAGTNPVSLFANTQPLGSVADVGSPFGLGVHFYSDTNGYVIGVRFYKTSDDTANTHTVYLWNDANQAEMAYAASSNETASGWQTVNFSSPVAITAGASYTASWVTQHFLHWDGFFQNFDHTNEPLHAAGVYITPTGRLDYSDNWPQNFVAASTGSRSGYPLVAQLGGATVGSGQVENVWQADESDNQYDTEGCQCMVGGIGPGPYAFINNYVEASGTVWHHDDSGDGWATRGDYTYQRNYFKAKLSEMIGSAQSDGLRYFHRHALEWKGGCRIQLYGNIFDTSWVEDTPFGDLLELSSLTGSPCNGDIDMQSNTFMHAGSLMSQSGATVTGGAIKPPLLPLRFRFQNNLAWDINAFTWCAYGYGFCPSNGGDGVLLNFQGNEDVIINHNTFVANQGNFSDLMWSAETRVEGVNITNNILWINSNDSWDGLSLGVCGLAGSGSDANCYNQAQYCKNLAGEAAASCGLQDYVFDHNLLTGNLTQAQLQSAFPSPLFNYVPASPSNLGGVGWFTFVNPTSTSNDYHLKANYISGANGGNDGQDVGMNTDALLAAQGAVTLVGVPNSSITTSAANVVFDAPDAAGCPVDYSSTDPTLINNFTRVSDSGGPINRSIALTGLSSQTVYFYRVNCAVEQPTGRFKTH